MKKGKVHPDDRQETELEDLATKRSFIEKPDSNDGTTQLNSDSGHKDDDHSDEEVEEEKIDRDRVIRSALGYFIDQSLIGRVFIIFISGVSVLTSGMFAYLTYFDSSVYDPCCHPVAVGPITD